MIKVDGLPTDLIKLSICSLADTSLESGISDDYAIPPDAVSNGSELFDWSTTVSTAAAGATFVTSTVIASPSHQKPSIDELCVEKSGLLAKLGGKLKTWRKRWFHLGATGVLRYWKSQVNTRSTILWLLKNRVLVLLNFGFLNQS